MSKRQYLSMSFILAVVLVSAAQAQTPKDSCAGWGYVYGDMDGDCFVNFVDYSEYAKAWGTQIGDDAYDPNSDINACSSITGLQYINPHLFQVHFKHRQICSAVIYS